MRAEAWMENARVRCAAVLAACAFLLCCLPLSAQAVQEQPHARGKGTVEEGAKKRWEALPEAERKRLLERYRSYRSLPEAERRRLRERFRALESLRRSLELPERPRDPRDLEAWKREVDRKVRRFLDRRVEEVDARIHGKAPRGKPPSHGDKDRRTRLRALRARLEQLNRKQLSAFLDRLVKEGVLTSMEAEKIGRLGPAALRRKIFELGKRYALRDLEGLLPKGELRRLESMDPFCFHRWRRVGKIPVDLLHAAKRLSSLTPEQRAALEKFPEGPDRQRAREAFTRKNLLDRLERLGLKRTEIKKMLSLPLDQRRRWILDHVRAWQRRQGELSPEARRLLGLPRTGGGRKGHGPGPRHEGRPGNGDRRGKNKNGEGPSREGRDRLL